LVAIGQFWSKLVKLGQNRVKFLNWKYFDLASWADFSNNFFLRKTIFHSNDKGTYEVKMVRKICPNFPDTTVAT
jgi:hypothetical protein